MRNRAKVAIQSTLLLIGSLLFALMLCEGMARLYAYLTPDQSVTNVTPSATDAALLKKYFNLSSLAQVRELERPLADRYVPGISVADGMERKWFDQLPARPERDPADVDPEAAALQTKYIRRGHYGPQSFYIWNQQFVKDTACDETDEIFHNLPGAVKVFRSTSPFPRYRFPANRTLPSGLKTNRYGFRGPDFPPQRTSNTIRIAFVGSSETMGGHSFPYSYPEYFGIWLSKWLAANGYRFHVEIINAGREGIGTADVVAILREEVLPLAPDYVIFYDSANQMLNAQAFAIAPSPIRHFSFKELLAERGPLVGAWTAHSRLAKIVNEAYRKYVQPSLDDWRRPKYEFKFPPGIDEASPDIHGPNLPLGLSDFLHDLTRMANDAHAAAVPFMISTLVWLDGSELTAGNYANGITIRVQLKSLFWPLKPSEIRRLIEFSNRTLRQFAKSDRIGLLDIAQEFPRNPDLFTDGYHMTPEGLKLLAWIGLQHFLPRLAEDLHDGKLGKTPPVSLHLPIPDGDDFVPTCHPTPEAMVEARSVPLSTMAIGSQGASLRPSASGVAFRSTAQPWAYIGLLSINAECVVGGGWIAADIRVTRGAANVGVLNKKGNTFLVQRSTSIRNREQTIFLQVDSFSNAGNLVFRNGADNSVSEGIIRAVRIATKGGAPPLTCPLAGMTATHAGSGSKSN